MKTSFNQRLYSVGAATWYNPESATEVSIAPGVVVNTENTATDYKTGSEFHVDFVANPFLSKTFAIGPGFVWIPEFGVCTR